MIKHFYPSLKVSCHTITMCGYNKEMESLAENGLLACNADTSSRTMSLLV